jgi:SPP1 gp7 family putative phage head morphogenesis protein
MLLTQFDSALELSLDLFRLDASVRADVLKLLKHMERELIAKVSADDISAFSKARIEKQLREINAVIRDYYSQVATVSLEASQGAVQVAVTETAKALSVTTASEAILPSATFIEALAGNSIVQGAVQAAWWERQSADTSWRFANAVRQGLVSAETNQQIISRVRTVMDVSRRNAAALVQTSVQTVANDARMATFKKNESMIEAFQWTATLDSHTCIRCAVRDGKQWDVDLKPIGHSMPWANGMLHFNDRCLIIPITKKIEGLPEKNAGTRASSDGQVAATTTFGDFLNRKGEAWQDDVLGKGRAHMWRDGKLSLQDLVNGSGNELTLAQLQAKYL